MFKKITTKIKEKLRPGSTGNQIQQENEIASNSKLDSSMQSAVDMSFFYTSDKALDAMDDNDILDEIIQKYPKFGAENLDKEIKAAFIQVLNDKDLMIHILDYYNINIYEFFTIVFKKYAPLFKGAYVKKVKQSLRYKSYAIKSRKAARRRN